MDSLLNSDDDFECSNGYSESYGSGSGTRLPNPNGLSKAELRKTNKPIMEKRRRARINHCLNELKSLILEAMKKDPARHTKLEKADILEMTVKHLQSVQRQQLNMAIQTDPSVVHKFKTGFVECAEEVNRYVSQLDGIDPGVRQRLTAHLNNCANSLEQIGSMSNFNSGYRGTALPTLFAGAANAPLHFPGLPQDLNNNNNTNSNREAAVGNATATASAIQMGGLQLIPSRLPSGEFALIMPNSATAAATAAAAAATGASAVPAAAAFGWPGAGAATNAMQLNDYAQSFRLSAFSKPAPAATAAPAPVPAQTQLLQPAGLAGVAKSPPLSPISSISSHSGDETRAHSPSRTDVPLLLSAKVAAAAQTHSFAGVFSTPPPTSAETSFNSSGSIMNTSSGSSSSHNSSHASTHLQQQQVSSTSGHEQRVKRERERERAAEEGSRTRTEREAADSSDGSLDEPATKKFLAAAPNLEKSAAWRPW